MEALRKKMTELRKEVGAKGEDNSGMRLEFLKFIIFAFVWNRVCSHTVYLVGHTGRIQEMIEEIEKMLSKVEELVDQPQECEGYDLT